jgi:hypothetical protein
MLGFAGWNSAAGRRAGLAASLYLGLFAIVGQPFNQYWGSLVAPLLCLGIAQAPDALTTLWRRAIRPHQPEALARSARFIVDVPR